MYRIFYCNCLLSKAIIIARANLLYFNLLTLQNLAQTENNQNEESNCAQESNLNKNLKNSFYDKKLPIFKIEKIYNKQQNKKHIRMLPKYKRRNRGSKYRGVCRKRTKWEAIIMINRQRINVGTYDTEEEAAKAYDKFAITFHKEKAKTNFIYE